MKAREPNQQRGKEVRGFENHIECRRKQERKISMLFFKIWEKILHDGTIKEIKISIHRMRNNIKYGQNRASQVVQWWRIFLPMQEMWVQSLGQEDSLEREMATHSSILVWEIPRSEEPGGPQSMGSQRAAHNLVTKQPKMAKATHSGKDWKLKLRLKKMRKKHRCQVEENRQEDRNHPRDQPSN